jgi:hypothetical protein
MQTQMQDTVGVFTEPRRGFTTGKARKREHTAHLMVKWWRVGRFIPGKLA